MNLVTCDLFLEAAETGGRFPHRSGRVGGHSPVSDVAQVWGEQEHVDTRSKGRFFRQKQHVLWELGAEGLQICFTIKFSLKISFTQRVPNALEQAAKLKSSLKN